MAEGRDVLAWGWEAFFSELVRFTESSERQFESHANQQYSEYVLDRLDLITQSATRIRDRLLQADPESQIEQDALSSLISSLNEILDSLPPLIRKWQQHLDDIDVHMMSSRYQVPVKNYPGPGRPRLLVTREQLEYLRSLSFTWTDISAMLNISRMTLHRRRTEYGMLVEPARSVTDSQLITIVNQLRRELPDVGQSLLAGRLRAMGLHVTRNRIREVVRRSDPLNTAFRWHGLTNRRPYSVPGPNSLWHIGIPEIMHWL